MNAKDETGWVEPPKIAIITSWRWSFRRGSKFKKEKTYQGAYLGRIILSTVPLLAIWD